MLQFVIEVSLRGSNVVVELDVVQTDPRVSSLHPRLAIIEDEVIVNALVAQPMLEAGISRLETIYGAIKSVPFDAMKVKLKIRKKINIFVAP